MTQTKLLTFAMTGLGLAVALAGCGSSGTSTGGTGGSSTGSGGSSTGSGGSGTGGIAATGGTTGTGGAATGGTTGTGGAATGGTTGTGGSGTGGGGGAATAGSGGGGTAGSTGGGGHSGFALTSPDQAEGAKFGTMYTCAAGNGTFATGVNPELDWTGAPAGTMSFAITFIDTTLGATSPLGQHWAMWNIPTTASKFPKAMATALSGATQSGKFLTPCAQSLMNGMDDQYEFTIYALSTATLPNVKSTNMVVDALNALKAVTPLGMATLHGHAGLKGQ